jgi:phosphate transport system substrate-binding protein
LVRRASALLLVAVLAACGGTVTPSPTAPPVPRVSVGLSALPLPQSLGETYLQEIGPLPFDLVPLPSLAGLQSVEDGDSLAHLDYPPVPDGWSGFLLGWEGIAVVVHAQVVVRQLDREDLAGVFTGRLTRWDQIGAGEGSIQPVIYPQGDRLRQAFVEQVMPTGRITTLARLGSTPQAVLEIVRAERGAIGLVPYRAVADAEGVAVLRIEGVLPTLSSIADGAYGLRLPLLALAPVEPQGEVREWLVWAQSSGGE